MADEERWDAGEDAEATPGRGPDDFSIPMWVWTLLGFTLITAVIIVVIIWGGSRDEAPIDADPPTMYEAAQTSPAETQPTTQSAPAPPQGAPADGF